MSFALAASEPVQAWMMSLKEGLDLVRVSSLAAANHVPDWDGVILALSAPSSCLFKHCLA